MKNGRVLGLDFETSGHSRWCSNAAVEIGLVEIDVQGQGRVVISSLLSGARWITYGARRVHGISLWQCRGKPKLASFRQLLAALCSQPLCVHGKGTERKVLKEELGLETNTWIDSLTLSRRVLKRCPNYQLKTVVDYMGLGPELEKIVPKGRWHRAAYDAAASALIVKELRDLPPLKEQNL